jgi:hypothetical protein
MSFEIAFDNDPVIDPHNVSIHTAVGMFINIAIGMALPVDIQAYPSKELLRIYT